MNHLEINKNLFYCDRNDYPEFKHPEYNNLKLYPIIGRLERYASLLNSLSELFDYSILTICGMKYSSFLSYECLNSFQMINIMWEDGDELEYLKKNIELHSMEKKVNIVSQFEPSYIIFIQTQNNNWISGIIDIPKCLFLICPEDLFVSGTITTSFRYKLSNSPYVVYVDGSIHSKFIQEFRYYIEDNILKYDNLIHLCVMVKNGGKDFEKMLIRNLPIIDQWTVLDTGSTDDTVEMVKRVLKDKKGRIYEEPFINFRESRNRCLELAGYSCKYNLMLDDTYCIEGELRDFLETVRSDQFADSYSLLIKSDDVEYYSNRITKSKNKLRYIYTIHEVIQKDNNINVVIPSHKSFVDDMRSPYMEERTMERKRYDLKCLFQMIEEYPDDPRHIYYIAQTYNLLNDKENAAEFFKKRAFHASEGFDQEKVDALFEMTRIYNFQLNRPWEECEKYYKLCHEWDPERPEASYFLGIHYYLENDYKTAFDYFKRAFEIGYPVHRQYSLKPTLSYHFLPKFFTKLCFLFDEYKLGLKSCELYLQHNTPQDDGYLEIKDFYSIFQILNNASPLEPTPIKLGHPLLCFIADGGFNAWSGSSILNEGVGGSETYIIEMARYIKKHSNYEVIVFCRCEKEEIFEGVKYLRLERVLTELSKYKFDHCIISRYSEYIPLAIRGHVDKIHVVVHDLVVSGNIIPINDKIKNIFCLTEWHKNHFTTIFPQLKNIIHAFHYGINFENFNLDVHVEKIKHSFIYSSFPNRGLIVVLKMWPRIKSRYGDAVLNIFCDLENKWANDNYPDEMREIKRLLNEDLRDESWSVKNHGWVDKKTLANFWRQSEIWFYPCRFKETFCLTALEAALSKTFAITNNLAALEDTVGDRGISIPGTIDDVMSDVWQDKAFDVICDYVDHPEKREDFVKRNFEWAMSHSWEERAKKLLNTIDPEMPTFNEREMPIEIKDVGKFYGYNDFISKYIETTGNWEESNDYYFDKYIHNDSIVIDIGAFIGTNTAKMAKRAKKVYSFEPVKQTFQLLKKNIDLNHIHNVELYDYAVGEQYKTIDGFWYSMEEYMVNYGTMRINHSHDLLNHCLKQETIMVRLDDIILNKIDFIKIDAEGYETNIIEGAMSLIIKYRPVILMENNHNEKYEKLLELGYKCQEIDKLNHNYIFIPDRNKFYLELNDRLYSKEEINYANMFNWTNDLPKNSKIIFDNILSQISDRTYHIMEVGTYAGTSLIHILQRLPNATAIAVDRWKNYDEVHKNHLVSSLKMIEENNIESIFDRNISISKMNHRVEKRKGDSVDVLLDLFKERQRFDFIYVDGSHRCVDVFVDCILSWKLLNINGVLAIDDYTYNLESDKMETPYYGVNEFLQKYKYEYKILDKGYRLFLEKIRD